MTHEKSVPEVPATSVPDDAFLLDVREDDEWAAGHAPDALHVPMGRLRARSGEVPRDRDVYVICRSGSRSAHATTALRAAGWTAVNVSDGMHGWASAGLPMVAESGGRPFVA